MQGPRFFYAVVPGVRGLVVALRGGRLRTTCAMQFFKDFSLSALSAGFVAALVGVTSSVALAFQAAQSFGATPAQISSWTWALGWGIGLCCAVPSLTLAPAGDGGMEHAWCGCFGGSGVGGGALAWAKPWAPSWSVRP